MKKTAKVAPPPRRAVHHPEPTEPASPKVAIAAPPPTVKLDRHTAEAVSVLRECIADMVAPTSPTDPDRAFLKTHSDTRTVDHEQGNIVLRTVTVVLAYLPSPKTVDVTL